eukprot:6953564-Prymnesium_polylepis.2
MRAMSGCECNVSAVRSGRVHGRESPGRKGIEPRAGAPIPEDTHLCVKPMAAYLGRSRSSTAVTCASCFPSGSGCADASLQGKGE